MSCVPHQTSQLPCYSSLVDVPIGCLENRPQPTKLRVSPSVFLRSRLFDLSSDLRASTFSASPRCQKMSCA